MVSKCGHDELNLTARLTWNILEQELMDSNDNHVFEVTNLKSIIVELQEKLEYDCRRLNREFSEKLDNVYECIEKLEIGREKKLNKGTFLYLDGTLEHLR